MIRTTIILLSLFSLGLKAKLVTMHISFHGVNVCKELEDNRFDCKENSASSNFSFTFDTAIKDQTFEGNFINDEFNIFIKGKLSDYAGESSTTDKHLWTQIELFHEASVYPFHASSYGKSINFDVTPQSSFQTFYGTVTDKGKITALTGIVSTYWSITEEQFFL